MNIAVIDVAAESGGALSVLKDFLEYISSLTEDEDEYYVFVSKEIDIVHPRIHYCLKPEIKKSWFSRLKWERFGAVKELQALNIDVVFSLQNTAFYTKKFRQVVYFHNVLLLEPRRKYSLFKKSERHFGIYTRVIAPYTMRSLKYADTIICQTDTVKKSIEKRRLSARVISVNPNVYVDEQFINTAIKPIKGYIYPTAPVPFKRIEEVIECVKKNQEWFMQNNLEMLVTLEGTENEYAKMLYELGKGINALRFIGYQKREDILRLYRDHALVINSELESFPLPFKEAELVGTPIVAADYSYAIEILGNKQGTLVFRKHQIDEMFEAMKRAASLGKITSEDLSKMNTWKLVVDEWK